MNNAVSLYLIQFLRNPKIQQLIKEDNWEAVYEELFKRDRSYITQLTQLLYLSDIDPLRYMNNIPNGFADHLEIKSLEIPNHIRSIGESAFWVCDQIQSVNIPDSVTSIGALAFAYCNKLKDVVLPSSVADIDISAFRGCPSLKEITYLGSIAEWRRVKKAGAFENGIVVHCSDGDLQLQGNRWVSL